jgi:hypothetical protein
MHHPIALGLRGDRRKHAIHDRTKPDAQTNRAQLIPDCRLSDIVACKRANDDRARTAHAPPLSLLCRAAKLVIDFGTNLLSGDARVRIAFEVLESTIEFGTLHIIEGHFRVDFLGCETVPEILSEFDAFGGGQPAEIEEWIRAHAKNVL